jgi:hypothetical protein
MGIQDAGPSHKDLDIGVAPCMKTMRVAVNTWAWYTEHPMDALFGGIVVLLSGLHYPE